MMCRIMLLNAKGGCGKTTIATNLASYFAGKGQRTALMDYDPQGSSLRWLELRDTALPAIQGIDAGHRKSGITRSWQLHTEPGTDLVVVDTPAGIGDGRLVDLMPQADIILVPIMPSVLDIKATAGFVRDLLWVAKARALNKRIAIVANRVREWTCAYRTLERCLLDYDIPVVARLRDAQNYIHALEAGKGIHELPPRLTAKDRGQWWPLTQWLSQEMEEKSTAPESMLAG